MSLVQHEHCVDNNMVKAGNSIKKFHNVSAYLAVLDLIVSTNYVIDSKLHLFHVPYAQSYIFCDKHSVYSYNRGQIHKS